MATGFTERRALSAARFASAEESIFAKSFVAAPAQPLPVPSGVRIVVESAAAVCRWYANKPLLLATAKADRFVSRKPVDTRLAAFETLVIALTAAARPAASSDAVASAHAGDGA